MRSGHRLGRQFGWLWGAYGTSALGTWLAFGAFPLIAIQVLHSGPAEVAALAAVGAAVGAVVAVPLGPWVEFRRKRLVLIALDLVRFAALLTIPVAFALGVLTFLQLLLVSVVVAAADITFRAASGAYLKMLPPAEDLLVANSRFESTTASPSPRPRSAGCSVRSWPARSSPGSGSTGSWPGPGRCARSGQSAWPSSGRAPAGCWW